jgi:hypothetical protein
MTLIGRRGAASIPVRPLHAFLWFCFCATGAQAATLERLSLDDMIQRSTAIVRGRVTGAYSAFRGSLIYTHYRVQISERWKGGAQSGIEVSVPGGVSGGLRQSYAGVPRLSEGKEYVFFLWTGQTGVTEIIGYTQGLFELPKKNAANVPRAYRAASMETMLDRETGRPVEDEPLDMSLEELSARIARVLSQGVRQ